MRQIDADFRDAIHRAFRAAIAMTVHLHELRILDEAFTVIAHPRYAIADQDYWDCVYQQLRDKHDLILLRLKQQRHEARDDYEGPAEDHGRQMQDVDELERKAEMWKYE